MPQEKDSATVTRGRGLTVNRLGYGAMRLTGPGAADVAELTAVGS